MKVGLTALGPFRVLCTGPAEWLAIGSDSEPLEKLLPLLEIAPAPLVCINLTDGLAHVQLSGAAIVDSVSSLCALDLNPVAFPPDTCARARFAGLPVIIDRRTPDAFDCYVVSSYLSYLLACLQDTAVTPGTVHP